MAEQKSLGALYTLWIAVVVFIVDQATKLWSEAVLKVEGTVIEVVPFFNLRLAYNKGAAFSFLADAGGWQKWFFALIALGVSVMLIFWLKKLQSNQKLLMLAYNLILAGALGNLFDRLAYGHVIDFLDFYYGTYHWPAFNIADVGICVGAGLLILDVFISDSSSTEGEVKHGNS